jgi:hypothetical protein
MAGWYTRHLAMRIVRYVETETNTHFLVDASGKTVIEIYHQSKAPVPDYAAMDPMVLHLAFSAPNVKEAREKLLAAGASSAGEVTIAPNGDELAMVRDPWGLTVQLVKRSRPMLET